MIGLFSRLRVFVGFGLFLLLLALGCRSTSIESQRVARYRPTVDPLPSTSLTTPDVLTDNGNSGSTVIPPVGIRQLSPGDRLMISLRGIPHPEEIKDMVDGVGEVNLPYIGPVKLAGKTTSQAEQFIERTYVDQLIYQHINVIVVAEDEVYFVQGQVSRQGEFPLSGPVTLLQAISVAGGFTPFGNRKNVKIIRGSELQFYNAKDIAAGEADDPAIHADDIIEVLQKKF